jgi:hypothetical protein
LVTHCSRDERSKRVIDCHRVFAQPVLVAVLACCWQIVFSAQTPTLYIDGVFKKTGLKSTM